MNSAKQIRILGTRGVPAAHGGFETFAEHLALYLVSHGWRVVVYCQEDGSGPVFEDTWQGVERIHIPVAQQGPKGTIIFDWKATSHAAQFGELCLTLGYNTAIFCALLRLKGVPNLINMDGIEWQRQKWGAVAKTWFWLNDWAGCWLGNHLVADHPEIKVHLSTRVAAAKITMIPYGADRIENADTAALLPYGLAQRSYAILIARAEPENSILEVVRAWSRMRRGFKLIVLGKYDPGHAYQQAVKAAASDEVIFPGAIYDRKIVNALRYHSLFYIHGHQVGGTNPSLVEALGAGNAVLAHDNRFNRWVAGSGAAYFQNEAECAARLDALIGNTAELGRMNEASRERHHAMFTWEKVLAEYEVLLARWNNTLNCRR
jgi:glycosyltransferase involved in cell wall biosynthesis